MTTAKIITALGALIMAGFIVYAFVVGDFSSEGAWIVSNPWGIVSLVDLYTGFVLFAGWIIYRERSWWKSLIWIALLMTLGFFIGSLYALIALMRSDGNWEKFWLGKARHA